jgi:hypothetical protein
MAEAAGKLRATTAVQARVRPLLRRWRSCVGDGTRQGREQGVDNIPTTRTSYTVPDSGTHCEEGTSDDNNTVRSCGSGVARPAPVRSDRPGRRGRRQPNRPRRLAHRWGGAVERLPRPQARRLPAGRPGAAGLLAGAKRHRTHVDGGVLRVRPGARILVTEALRPCGCPHP